MQDRTAPVPVIDCDIHPVFRNPAVLKTYLARDWHDRLDTYGMRYRQALMNGPPYPKAAPALARRDAWPTNGAPPGSDLEFMRAQHLDPYNIQAGILHVLSPAGRDILNPDLGNAVCRAVNDWLVAEWLDLEPRLSATINIVYDDPEAAVAEIRRCARHPGFVGVAFASRTTEPMGNRRYWPIYRLAEELGLPISVHTGGANGVPTTSGGWPSFYAEDHHGHALSMQTVLTSMTYAGVFEAFPKLKLVLVEAGFAWAPSLIWRMDRQFDRMRDEVPNLRRKPSEYLRQNVWYATQPVDEPQNGRDILATIDWLGWDRLVFSSDYPHWDMDDPRFLFKAPLSTEERNKILGFNALDVYNFRSVSTRSKPKETI